MGLWQDDGQSWSRAARGAALVVVAIVLVELTSRFVVHIPNPPAVLILVVAYTAFRGGLRTGIASAVLAWAYFAIAFSGDSLFAYSADDLRRVIIWGAMTPALALMIGTLRSKLRAAERAAIREAETRFTRAFHASPVGVVLTRRDDGVVLDINQVALDILGYASDEVLGRSTVAIGMLDADVRASLLEQLARDGAVRGIDVAVRTKAGARVDLLVSAEALGSAAEGRVLVFFVDLTERRRVEAALHRREQQLQATQKMEAIGRMAGGIAHDFNNLLTIISANAALLRSLTSEADRELVADISEATKRAATLTRQLLLFSRQEAVQPVLVDVGTVLGNLRSFLTRTIGETIELSTHLEPGLVVRADPGQLDQVITNLVLNARDAMPGGGVLTLACDAAELDELGAARLGGQARPGRFVQLTVRDTGTGMTDDVRDRIFEPFFTTKGAMKGTGLGLATVYAIATKGQGFVVVDSSPGTGSAFHVYLPREATPATGPAAPEPAQPRTPRSEQILLIEDDRAVRDALRRMLSVLGYRVLVADGPDAALELAQAPPSPIELIITDVVMPRMGGREVVEKLAPLVPNARVLFISGYANDASLVESIRLNAVAFLSKPFTVEALDTKVRELLDRPK